MMHGPDNCRSSSSTELTSLPFIPARKQRRLVPGRDGGEERSLHNASSVPTIRAAYGGRAHIPSSRSTEALGRNGIQSPGFSFENAEDNGNNGNKGNTRHLGNIRSKRRGKNIDALHIELSSEIRRLRGQRDGLYRKIRALEVDGEEAQAKVDSLTVARERSVGLINALEGRLSEVKQSSAQEVEQLGSQLKTVQVQAEQLNDDLSELHEKHAATERELLFSRSRESNSRSENEKLLARIHSVSKLEENVKQLEHENAQIATAYASLQAHVDSRSSEFDGLRKTIQRQEADLDAYRRFRKAQYRLLADPSAPGVRRPERIAGGYGSYPLPSISNVTRAVKQLIDGKLRRPSSAPIRRRKRQMRGPWAPMLASTEKLLSPSAKKTGSIDARLLIIQIRDGLRLGRTLYGKKVSTFASLFRAIDLDRSGSIDRRELEVALHRLGLGVHSSQIDTLLEGMGDQHDGKNRDSSRTISEEAFLQFCQSQLQ